MRATGDYYQIRDIATVTLNRLFRHICSSRTNVARLSHKSLANSRSSSNTCCRTFAGTSLSFIARTSLSFIYSQFSYEVSYLCRNWIAIYFYLFRRSNYAHANLYIYLWLGTGAFSLEVSQRSVKSAHQN